MTGKPDPEVAQMEGAAALPRRNGELVFDALWEGRVFGMAVAMHERGYYPWREFRDLLVEEIAAADAAGDSSGYYQCFLAALERLALSRGLVSREELEARTAEYAAGARDELGEHEHEHDHGMDGG